MVEIDPSTGRVVGSRTASAHAERPATERVRDPQTPDTDDPTTGPVTTIRTASRRAKPPKRRWWAGVASGVGFALKCLAPVVLIAAILFGFAYVRLSNGPISLEVLRSTISASLTSDLPGLAADFDSVELVANARGIALQLRNIRLSETNGGVVAHAPAATITLSSVALLSGIAAPERISLIQPSVFGFTNDNGGISFLFATDTASEQITRADGEARAHETSEARLRGSLDAGASAGIPTTAPGAPDSKDARAAAFDLTQTIQRVVARRPRKVSATRYLKSIGLVAPRLIIQHQTRHTVLLVRRVDVDLIASREGLALAGRLEMPASQGGALTFSAKPVRSVSDADAARQRMAGSVAVEIKAEDINPARFRSLGDLLGAAGGLDSALSGRLAFFIEPGGVVDDARLHIDVGTGHIVVGGLSGSRQQTRSPRAVGRSQEGGEVRVAIQGASLDFRYDTRRRRIEMTPSRMRVGRADVTLVGAFSAADDGAWTISLNATEGRITSSAEQAGAIRLDRLRVRGRYEPNAGALHIRQALLAANGGLITAAGTLGGPPQAGSEKASQGAAVGSVHAGAANVVRGDISGMAFATLIAAWPADVMPGPRAWFAANVASGTISRGRFAFSMPEASEQRGALSHDAVVQTASARVASGAPNASTARQPAPRITADLTLDDVRFRGLATMPWMTGGDVRVRLEGATVDVTAEEAKLMLPGGGAATMRALGYRQTRLWAGDQGGVARFSVKGTVPQTLALLAAPAFGIDAGDILRAGAKGDVEAELKLALPAVVDVVSAQERGDTIWPVVTGRARITKGRVAHRSLPHPITDGDLTIALQPRTVTLDGAMKIAGVPATAQWQRLLPPPEAATLTSTPGAGATPDREAPAEPLHIRLRLDDAAREKLELGLSAILSGRSDIDIMVSALGRAPKVSAAIDLTAAKIAVDSLGYTKPVGRRARLTFDAVAQPDGSTLLRDVALTGDRIGVRGTARIDRSGELVSVDLPKITFDLLSTLGLRGRRLPRRGDGPTIWSLDVDGQTVDGRGFFRRLFSVDNTSAPTADERRFGMDLQATFATVLGFHDTSLRAMTVRMSKRGGRLQTLSAQGTLTGGAKLDVAVEALNGRRRLAATTADAGAAFRLVSFYPSMRGGALNLRVNLDGRRADEKTGLLQVTNFAVLGDEVVRDVVSAPDVGRPAIAGGGPRSGRQVATQDVIEFERLRAPFSVGYGQFVIHDADLVGPLLGGSIRGKVDFRSRTMLLGGTYSFLQGLNALPKYLPAIGQILTGIRQEGISATTFAVQGPLDRPEVIVNPLSPLLPGILRELMQITPENPQLSPRGPNEGTAGGWRTGRASRRQRPSDAAVRWDAQTTPGVPSYPTGPAPSGWDSRAPLARATPLPGSDRSTLAWDAFNER
ncbi:MAG: AsmA-like C-terminal region-containing protein [Pseudomonadota bacterium]